MFALPNESSFEVCESSWPLCLSGLNCLITVIIWTGSKFTWHADTVLVWLKKKKTRKKEKKILWKTEWMLQGSPEDEWRCLMCEPEGCDVLTHIHKTARMHIQYIHLHVSEFLTSPGHFGAIRWKSSMSEPQCLQRKVQGLCDLFMTLLVLPVLALSALCCNLCWLTDQPFAFSYAACSLILFKK